MELELGDVESDFPQEEKDQQRYRSTRNGDHLMKVPCVCDLCHFRNMNKRDPVSGSKRYEDTFVAIRRAQLDVFWARESSTIASNHSCLRRDYLDSTTMSTPGEEILPYLHNHAVVDRVRMVPVIMTLGASL